MKIDKSIVIHAPGRRILAAFFDPGALRAWWGVRNAVTTPRALGPYALEWPLSDLRDEVLGSLGGVFRGTVVQFDGASGFFVADLFWLPPEGDPIGPMALDVMVAPEAEGTRLRVTQSGFDESARWRRYYEVVDLGWERALAALKRLLERRETEVPARAESQQQR